MSLEELKGWGAVAGCLISICVGVWLAARSLDKDMKKMFAKHDADMKREYEESIARMRKDADEFNKRARDLFR